MIDPRPTRRVAAIVALAVLAAWSCSPDRSRLEPTEPGDEEFTLGPTTTYTVESLPGGSVADSISGGSFTFPEGGSGTLLVARITDSPLTPPAGADGFWAEYTGDEKLELRLARTTDSIPLLWVYGFGDASPADPMADADTWWPMMPEDTLSDPAVFPLFEPGMPGYTPAATGTAGVQIAGGRETQPIHSYKFMRRKASTKEPAWVVLTALRETTGWTVQDVIAALPSGLRGFATSETSGRLAFRSYEVLPAPEVSAYAAFQYYTTYLGDPYRRLYPMLSYVCSGTNIATEATVAHEVGHYFTHVFFGDDAFEALTRAQLRTNHDIGSVHSERPMLEEYAMFVDYFKNGNIRAGSDVEEPRQLLIKSARIVNFPNQEAYATCLLARMHVANDTIHTVLDEPEDIPVVGMSFTDIFDILYSRKPTTVNALRSELAFYLAARGKADRLPAILERTGWSYNGYGTVLDDRARPVANALVQSVCKVPSENGREYLAPLEPVLTDGQGRFTLPRIFPGTHSIRVSAAGKEADFPYTVDPNARTDYADDIGPLILDDTVISVLRRTKYVQFNVSGLFTRSDSSSMYGLLQTGFGWQHQIQWTGNEFALQYADSVVNGLETYGERMECTARFSDNGRTLLRLQCHLVDFWRWQGQLTEVKTTDLDVEGLPLTTLGTSTPGAAYAYFDLETAAIDPNLRSISYVDRSYIPDRTITVTNFNWTSPGDPGHLGIVLFEQGAARDMR